MKYCIVNSDNIITNIIVASATFADSIGALPEYEGAQIGGEYAPITEPTTDERVTALEEQLAESDAVAMALYETNVAQEAVNAEQDEAILGLYEMIGG